MSSKYSSKPYQLPEEKYSYKEQEPISFDWYCFDHCSQPFAVLGFDGDNEPVCCPFCSGTDIRKATIEDFVFEEEEE